ncbi:phasin family protein [Neisseriaceae bacterium JH1-16]|nr:phasin family protein [Neisseriaceae bacterium JH1-16]
MENPQFAFSPWAEACQSHYSNTLKASNIGVECAEKIFNLQIDLMKEIIGSTAEAFKGLNDVKNPQDLSSFHDALTKPTLEKSIATSNAICEILAETQQRILAISLAPMPEAWHLHHYHPSKSEESALKKSSQRAAEQL